MGYKNGIIINAALILHHFVKFSRDSTSCINCRSPFPPFPNAEPYCEQKACRKFVQLLSIDKETFDFLNLPSQYTSTNKKATVFFL